RADGILAETAFPTRRSSNLAEAAIQWTAPQAHRVAPASVQYAPSTSAAPRHLPRRKSARDRGLDKSMRTVRSSISEAIPEQKSTDRKSTRLNSSHVSTSYAV